MSSNMLQCSERSKSIILQKDDCCLGKLKKCVWSVFDHPGPIIKRPLWGAFFRHSEDILGPRPFGLI